MSTQQHKRRFLINAISSSLQSVVVAATLFFLYRFLLKTIPVEHIGIWSVIFAAASIGKLAEMGVSAGVVKFVAAALARSEEEEAAKSIQTAATATSVGIGLCMLLAYASSPLYLSWLVGKAHMDVASSVLGLALLSFWLSSVASVFQSALDGCHRMDSRSMLNIATTLLHFVLCLAFTPSWGLWGLGLSQIIQALVTLVGNQLMLRRYLPSIGFRFWGWNTLHFRALLRYGLNAQLASVSITLLSEPITKAFITNFGGLGMVAYYDMATRMISQLRSVVLSAFQAMVPMVSHLHENNREQLRELYVRASQSMSLVALPLFGAIAAFAPYISLIWIGRVESVFVYSSSVLAAGWCLNTLIVPAYMINLGTGQLSWNTRSHIVIGIVNSLAGWALCEWIGPSGAILAWSGGLAIGSLALLLGFHKENSIRVALVCPANIIGLSLTITVLAIVVPLAYQIWSSRTSSLNLGLISLVIFLLAILPFVLQSDIAKSLRRFIGTHLAKQP